jgi:hypothetical protein
MELGIFMKMANSLILISMKESMNGKNIIVNNAKCKLTVVINGESICFPKSIKKVNQKNKEWKKSNNRN